MRKVTASAVILTALTGCGQNSGIPSTQWSFEIPSEDEISSLALNRDTSDTNESTFVSTVDNRALTGQSAVATSGAVSNGDMMGPAFNQPPTEIGAGLSTASISGRLGSDGSALSLSRAKSGGSISSSGLTSRYQPVAARPDPIAEVKAFLMANSSPSALSNREPYRSDILAPSLPAVYLPTASITSTLGDPTGMESQVAYADNASFTSAGLPVIEPSAGGVYGSSSNFDVDASTAISNTAISNQRQSIYQPVDYSSANAADVSLIEESSTAMGSAGLTEPSAMPSGLPVLESSNPQKISLGTAILQDLQSREAIQSAPSLPAEENSNGRIDIEFLPAEVMVSDDDAVAGAQVVSDRPDNVSASAPTSIPTLESLRRSVVVREVSPLVAYASQLAEADMAVDSNLAVEAIAVSAPQSDSPTLESLLETMPETAAQPNFAVELPDSNAASPLLEGFNNTQPLSTLYLPIPEATSGSDADALLSTNVSLVKNSLTSLGQRRTATVNLVDKLSAKRRQLVTY